MTLDEELRRLQHVHEKALRAAQRQEDTRRKRLHFEEKEQRSRKLLSDTMAQKRKQVLNKKHTVKVRVKKRLAVRHAALLERKKVTAEQQKQIELQRQQQVEEVQAEAAKRVAAKKKKLRDYARKRSVVKTLAMARVKQQRKQHHEQLDQESQAIGERMSERLSKTQAAQKAFLHSLKSKKGIKNKKWLDRVKLTKNAPDLRTEAIEVKIAEKYDKIAQMKEASKTLQKHRKMLQDKLARQKAMWAKEYKGNEAPSSAQIANKSRVVKKDLVRIAALPGMNRPSTASPSRSRPSSAASFRKERRASATP